MSNSKVVVFGAGYVGLPLAILLSRVTQVTLYDINQDIVQKINNRVSPIMDAELSKELKKSENISATSNLDIALKGATYAVVCTPTNYNKLLKSLDTSIVERNIAQIINFNPNITIIIRSTVPIGFTDSQNSKFIGSEIIFSPEFLREGNSFSDSISPSRVIMGSNSKMANDFVNILKNCFVNNPKVMMTTNKEAETIKLFSNAYLAMRVAFFNELDSFAIDQRMDTKAIIEGMCSDTRIGNYYNNPSFGYGGYCLPKDTLQLNKSMEKLKAPLISSISQSNHERLSFLASKIVNEKGKIIGFYRLVMKEESDNFRNSSSIELLKKIDKNVEVLIYEPLLDDIDSIVGNRINISLVNDLNSFFEASDIILANRYSKELEVVKEKLFTRDICNVVKQRE